MLAELTRDLEKRSDLFGTFNLTPLGRVNSGGESVNSSTTVAFSRTLKKLNRDGNASFVISTGFGMPETW